MPAGVSVGSCSRSTSHAATKSRRSRRFGFQVCLVRRVQRLSLLQRRIMHCQWQSSMCTSSGSVLRSPGGIATVTLLSLVFPLCGGGVGVVAQVSNLFRSPLFHELGSTVTLTSHVVSFHGAHWVLEVRRRVSLHAAPDVDVGTVPMLDLRHLHPSRSSSDSERDRLGHGPEGDCDSQGACAGSSWSGSAQRSHRHNGGVRRPGGSAFDGADHRETYASAAPTECDVTIDAVVALSVFWR